MERRKGGWEERKEATPVYFRRFSLSSVPGKIQSREPILLFVVT